MATKNFEIIDTCHCIVNFGDFWA